MAGPLYQGHHPSDHIAQGHAEDHVNSSFRIWRSMFPITSLPKLTSSYLLFSFRKHLDSTGHQRTLWFWFSVGIKACISMVFLKEKIAWGYSGDSPRAPSWTAPWSCPSCWCALTKHSFQLHPGHTATPLHLGNAVWWCHSTESGNGSTFATSSKTLYWYFFSYSFTNPRLQQIYIKCLICHRPNKPYGLDASPFSETYMVYISSHRVSCFFFFSIISFKEQMVLKYHLFFFYGLPTKSLPTPFMNTFSLFLLKLL